MRKEKDKWCETEEKNINSTTFSKFDKFQEVVKLQITSTTRVKYQFFENLFYNLSKRGNNIIFNKTHHTRQFDMEREQMNKLKQLKIRK